MAEKIKVKILACRPASTAGMPQEVQEAFAQMQILAPIGPGWTEEVCQACGCLIHMGPRQHEAYDVSPEEYLMVCMLCAVTSGKMFSTTTITHLGGK